MRILKMALEKASQKVRSWILDCHSQSKTWSHLGNDYLTLVCHIRGMKIPRIHFCTISFQQNPWIYIQSCLKRCFWNHHVILVIWPKWCKMMQSMINYFIWILTEIRIFFQESFWCRTLWIKICFPSLSAYPKFLFYQLWKENSNIRIEIRIT